MTDEPPVPGPFLEALRLTKSAAQNRREADFLETLLELSHQRGCWTCPVGKAGWRSNSRRAATMSPAWTWRSPCSIMPGAPPPTAA